MIEILALVFLTRKIGALALQKGQKPSSWKTYTVLAWFGFEIAGAFIGMIISQNIVLAALLGLGCAAGGYLLMKYKLDQMPDIDNNWEKRLGQSDDI